MPWDPKRFNIEGCLDRFGFVDWRQFLNVSIGDIVFIYGKKPLGQIAYMFQVVASNLSHDEIEDNSDFTYWAIPACEKYCRLKLIAAAPDDNDAISYEALKQHGVKSNLQKGIYLSDNLIEYIISNFDVALSDDETTYSEGTMRHVYQSQYEQTQDY